MKILITGSAGFIGFHLVSKLINKGYVVYGLDNINNYYDENLKFARLNEHGIKQSEINWNKLIKSSKFENYSFIKLNLEDRDQINKLFEDIKFDSVCNLAAQAGVRYSIENPHAYLNSNITGFLNIIEACRNFGVNNLSYASSSSVYGLNEKMPLSTSDNVDHPISLYAASKKSNELIAHTYSHLYKISTTGLRFFTVYGPWGRPDMALFLFTDAIIKNKPIKLFNNGQMVRDFTYVDDIVEGIVNVIENPAKANKDWSGMNPNPNSSRSPYKVYNIGNSSPVNLMDYVKALENSLDRVSQKEYLAMQPGDVRMTHADVSDLKKDFNYSPNTKIENGINSFVSWYKKYYKIN